MSHGRAAPWYGRSSVRRFVYSPAAQNVVIAVILINAVILGLQTAQSEWAGLLDVLDRICVAVYVVEIALKLYADRLRFFRSGWNVFDFVIVATALIPGGASFAVLRALRVLRVLRLVSAVPALRRVVDGLGRAIPGILSVGALLVIIFYVGAVMATTLYGGTFPHLFGSLKTSLFTLFQMMTLDDWANVTREVTAVHTLAPVFFIVFVFVSALTVLNLVVAVIVDAMQQFDSGPAEVADEIAQLRFEVHALRTALTTHQVADADVAPADDEDDDEDDGEDDAA